MTSSLAVRTAWEENLWEAQAVLDITPRIFLYDVLADSQKDVGTLFNDGQINFFTCFVSRAQDPLMSSQIRQSFRVEVRYYLQQTDVADNEYNSVQDNLEVVDNLVYSTLGQTWDGTIDYFEGGEPLDIAVVQIDGKQCWRGGLRYLAFKTI